jgi:hypothetical protein
MDLPVSISADSTDLATTNRLSGLADGTITNRTTIRLTHGTTTTINILKMDLDTVAIGIETGNGAASDYQLPRSDGLVFARPTAR